MNIEINVLRSVVTVGAFASFLAILVWAYLPARQKQFDEAARLPFKSE
jgi:cytochrome c oxidase cbb3-type subunit 4